MTYRNRRILRSKRKYFRNMRQRDFFRATWLTLWASAVACSSWAQSAACDNLLELCGQTDTTVTLNSPFDLPGAAGLAPEFQPNRVQIIEFHTTYFNQFGGQVEPVSVVLSDLACGDSVFARIFQPNPFDACNAAEFTAASESWSTAADTTFVSDGLYQNTDYVLVLGSRVGGCSGTVRLDGLAVSIDACCASTMDYGETAGVEVLGSDPELGFDWNPAEYVEMVDNQYAELTPFETTTFEVTGYVEGCEYTDAVLIAVGSPVDVPNAFSPNNDAFNDSWNIFGLSSFPTSTIEVFDRWGQSVYRSVSYPNPWGGKNRGVDVPAGTYYYVIHLNEPNANLAPITGHVAVIR